MRGLSRAEATIEPDQAAAPAASSPSTTPLQPARGRRHRALWIVGGALAAVVAAVLTFEALGWPFLRGPLQRAAEQRAGVPVRIGESFELHLLKPRLRVDELSIGAAPGFDVPHLVSGTGVELGWRWGDLRRWQRGQAPLVVRRLHAATLDAHLLRRADGAASWQIGSAPQAPRERDDDALPRFGSLSVGAGRIVVDDRVLATDLLIDVEGGETRVVGPGSGAPAASPAARGAAGAASAAASTPGGNGYRASVKGRYRALPLDLRVTAGALLPLTQDAQAAGDGAAANVPLRVEGSAGASRLLFDGTAAALLGARRLDGALRFRGPSLAQVGEPLGLTLPRTAPFDLVGRLGHEAGVWRLVADGFTLGRSRLNGDFVYAGNARPGRLTGTLGGRVLALADLGPAIGVTPRAAASRNSAAAAPAPPEPAPPRGKVLPQRRFDIPSLRAMNADVKVAIDELDLGSAAIAPLTGLRTQVRLDAGVLRLDDLQAHVAGGRLSGATRYDGNAQPPRWDADLRFAGVDIAGWVRAVQAPGAKGGKAPAAQALRQQRKQARAGAQRGGEQPVRAYVTGALASEVQVHGRGRSTGEILGSLQGRAQATVRDGTMSHLVTEALGLDLAQALGVAVRGDRPLPLRCARFDLAIADGVATPRLAVIDNPDSIILIGGRVSLRDETLALRATSRPKDISPFSLRTPVTITGTLADPDFGIEGKRLAGRAAAAAVLGAIAGPAALLPFVDFGSKGADPCVAQPAASAAKPASGTSR